MDKILNTSGTYYPETFIDINSFNSSNNLIILQFIDEETEAQEKLNTSKISKISGN